MLHAFDCQCLILCCHRDVKYASHLFFLVGVAHVEVGPRFRELPEIQFALQMTGFIEIP
jgi:hypothetical protein